MRRIVFGASLVTAMACVGAAALAAQEQASQEMAPIESVVGPPHGQPLAGDALDRRTQEVAALLRCPVCQGLSVADSPAATAVNMRTQVRDLLARGYDSEQTLTYFERSYGEFVRLKPPLRGVNWLVWIAPGVCLIAGVIVATRILRRATRPAAATTASPAPATEDAELDRYVRIVREMYGATPHAQSDTEARE